MSKPQPTKKDMKKRRQAIREDRDSLGEGEREIRLMGDQFDEAEMEREEARNGDDRDVVQETDPFGGDPLPEEGAPEGYEGAVRGIEGDEDVIHREDEDEETGQS